MTRRLWAEGIGTGLLLYLIVGSGLAVDDLGGEGVAALFAHAVVVGAGLAVIIALFITVSGAHFNPAVTLAAWRTGMIERRQAGGYVAAQLGGGLVGVVVAHLTFARAAVDIATVARPGLGRPLAEFVGTFVLVAVILVLVRTERSSAIPVAVGAWVAAIVFGTSSTGFANPAVTLTRPFTESFTGIAPRWVPLFLVAQLAAGLAAAAAVDSLFPDRRKETA